jgi:methionine-R-sulfoxide reductase
MNDVSDDYAKKKLDKKSFDIMRRGETEPAFSSNLLYNKEGGVYECKLCKNPLFSSDDKFDSGTGWPSFLRAKNVQFREDKSHGMIRTEVLCKSCKSHLGHVFDEATETGKRFCINGRALEFHKSS